MQLADSHEHMKEESAAAIAEALVSFTRLILVDRVLQQTDV
jgi:DNA repair exonuclease SbcCD ATPase subunit